MTNVLRSKNLLAYPQITQAVSTSEFGTMKKEDGQVHHANLLKFVKKMTKSSIAICMHQIHSGNVQIVENSRELVLADTDSLVTNQHNLALTVVIADCLPVFFFDPEKQVIGIAHAGRKGLLQHILQNTLDVFIKNFQSDPKDILVSIGPGIEKKCYEVNKEIISEFHDAFPDFQKYYDTTKSAYYLDLTSIAVQSLQKGGILREHIETSDICTKCTNELYSYRRGDQTERIAGIITLEE